MSKANAEESIIRTAVSLKRRASSHMNSDGFLCSRPIRIPLSAFFRKVIDIEPLHLAARVGWPVAGGIDNLLTAEERRTRPHAGACITGPRRGRQAAGQREC